jgi:hypothetical protein
MDQLETFTMTRSPDSKSATRATRTFMGLILPMQ